MSKLSEVENLPVTAIEVLPSVMTEAEARQCIEEINSNVNQIRFLLVELESREGYAALGFANMSRLMQSSLFAKARSTLQKELQAGRIERHHLNVPIGTFNESHLRPFAKLNPDYYKYAVDRACNIAGSRSIGAKDMSQAVAELLRTDPNAAKQGFAERPVSFERLPYLENDVVKICRGGSELKRHFGYWGVIQHVGSFNCTVHISLKSEDVQCKENEMRKIEPEKAKVLREVSERIAALVRCRLDPAVWAILQTINQQEDITQVQLDLLAWAEQRYEIRLYDN